MTDQDEIERVSLGRSGVTDTPLGIGTWSWGDRLFWNYGSDYDKGDVHAAFRTSLEAGVNFFDTAEIYGWNRSEELLGEFLAETVGTPVTATKYMPWPWRLRQDDLLRALEDSLDRLGLDQVDLYQIHHPIPPRSIETWVEALADAVEAGLVRAAGVSNYDLHQMQRAYAVLEDRGIPLASNQVAYSLLDREPERNGLLDACRELDVTLIAYSPLAQGLLTGKYTPENRPSGVRRFRYRKDYLVRTQPLVDLVEKIGRDREKTPAQVAINWVICKGAVPIPGAKNAQQARDNAGALGWRLTDDEVEALDRTSEWVEPGTPF